MQFYLMQHGEALAENQDPDRPLSEKGLNDVRRMAAFAARIGIQVAEIRHSAILRSAQTASEMEQALNTPKREMAGLTPNDDINPLRRESASFEENIMVIGHLPYLSRLMGSLLCQDESYPVVKFHMGCMVRLDRREDGRWSLIWALPAELIAG